EFLRFEDVPRDERSGQWATPAHHGQKAGAPHEVGPSRVGRAAASPLLLEHAPSWSGCVKITAPGEFMLDSRQVGLLVTALRAWMRGQVDDWTATPIEEDATLQPWRPPEET